MHEDTQYNVDCGAGEPTKEEHPCCKERQGICVMIRQKNLVFAGVPRAGRTQLDNELRFFLIRDWRNKKWDAFCYQVGNKKANLYKKTGRGI